MIGRNTTFITLAAAVDSGLIELDVERANLLKALAAPRVGSLRSFPGRVDDVRGNLRSRYNHRDIVTLAAISIIASAEAEFSRLVTELGAGDATELLKLGRLVSEGTREELDEAVALLLPGGWANLDQFDDGESVIGVRARCGIAAAADTFFQADPDRLCRSAIIMARKAPHTPALPVEVLQPPPANASSAMPDIPRIDLPNPPDEVGHYPDTGALTSLASILTRRLVPRRSVFGTMIERGTLSMLVAIPGAGKTMLSMQIACAVASGKSWAGFAVPAASRVIYVNNEDSSEEVARRFQAAHDTGVLSDEALGRIFVADRKSSERFVDKSLGKIATTEYGLWFQKEVAIVRPSLIVIDPTAMIHGLDENSNVEMAALADYLIDVATAGDAGILLVHHAGKDAKAGLWAARGASSIAASVRSMWYLTTPAEKERDDFTVQLACVKANYHPMGSDRSFRRVSHELASGDTVGLLVPISTSTNR